MSHEEAERMSFTELSEIQRALARASFVIQKAPRDPVKLEKAMVDIAKGLGEPRGTRKGAGFVDHLVPSSKDKAHPRSLSAQYGFGAFPWHSDGAHWPVPPRYLVIGCASASPLSAKTEVCEVSKISSLQAESAGVEIFAVRNGRHSFYSSIVTKTTSFVRHDPGCMEPLSRDGRTLQDDIEQDAGRCSFVLDWRPGMIAIIDNWRCLHRRGGISCDSSRHLLRISVVNSP